MLTRTVIPAAAILLVGASILPIGAAQTPPVNPDTPGKSSRVCDVYPGLASNSLTYAKLSDLPAGVLLNAEGVTLTDKDVTGEIAKVPQEMQAQRQAFAGGFRLYGMPAVRHACSHP